MSQQLKPPSSSWLDRISRSLCHTINHDATLESWQELYRLVLALDFGTGAPVAITAAKQVLLLPQSRPKGYRGSAVVFAKVGLLALAFAVKCTHVHACA